MTVLNLLNNKTVRGLLIAIFIWTFFDVLWDLFLSILHSLMLIAHYVFELCEHGLDNLVEHLFHTSPRTTEIIVFYILVGIGSAIAYLILRKIPLWCCSLCEHLRNYWLQEKTKAVAFWQSQTPILKAKWYALAFSCTFVMYFLALS